MVTPVAVQRSRHSWVARDAQMVMSGAEVDSDEQGDDPFGGVVVDPFQREVGGRVVDDVRAGRPDAGQAQERWPGLGVPGKPGQDVGLASSFVIFMG